MTRGSLTIVGTGLRLGVQTTTEARARIRSADKVFAQLGDPIAMEWLRGLNANCEALNDSYGDGRSRIEAYAHMVERIVSAVKAGGRICAVFYGHPGVFVSPSHDAIAAVRAMGLEAIMLPAVSAEDCLFADLGIDPGQLGCLSYEATDFLFYQRPMDPAAALILWQIGVVGDTELRSLEPAEDGLRRLRDILLVSYPADHEVIVYESATLPIGPSVQTSLALSDLENATLSQVSTLYVPPCRAPQRRRDVT